MKPLSSLAVPGVYGYAVLTVLFSITFLRAYNSALLRRPLITNCLSAAVLFGSGDFIAQQVFEKKGINGHDYARTARLTFYAGALFGPCLTGWYGWLNAIKFASPKWAVVYRTSLDQAIFTPFSVVLFYGSMSVLEGKKTQEVIDRLKRAFVPTLLLCWGVFIPTQAINFSIMPAHWRFPVASVVGLFWDTYLSYANEQQRIEAEAGAEALEEKA